MAIKFKKNCNAALICRLIDQRRAIEDDSVRFSGFDIDSWVSLTTSFVDFDHQKDHHIQLSAVRKAIFDPTLGENFEPADLIKSISKASNIQSSMSRKKFRTVFGLTQDGFENRRIKSSRGNFLVINPPLSSIFMKRAIADRKEIALSFTKEISLRPYEAKTFITVRVKALNPNHAHALARHSIDEFRGALNLANNIHSRIRLAWDDSKPLNHIQVAPFSTVHNLNGTAAVDGFWFDQSFRQPSPLSGQRISNALKQAETIIESARSSPFRSLIFSNLVLYANAYDDPIYSSCLQKSWTILENLTLIDGARYDTLVKRAASFFKDSEVAILFVEHLRHQRNKIVHGAHEPTDGLTLVDQIRRVVEEGLRFYISNEYEFENTQEVKKFLDAPTNPKSLQKKISELSSEIETLKILLNRRKN